MVAELAKYDFGRTDVDAKGAAYQELVGTNLRGDRGQYFTPRGAIELMVAMLDPKEDERFLDPACGTGGFLVATLNHLSRRFHEEGHIEARATSRRRTSFPSATGSPNTRAATCSAPTSTRSSCAPHR